MATSALKSASMAPPPSMIGADDSYSIQYEKAMEAEQRLADMLERKQSGGLSPSMLAFAGEMLDPGRTGSFGEALGRAAKGYAATQQVEQKRLLEDAAMRMQLEQMKLDRALRAQGLKTFQGLSTRGQPSPEGRIPEGASGPALKVQGMLVTPDDIAQLMYTNPDLGKALETGYKLRLESIRTQPGWVFDASTGEFTPGPGQEPKAEPVPEINGTLLMSPADADRLRKARAAGDAKTVYQIIDLYQKGVGPRPTEKTVVEPKAEAEEPKVEVADMSIEGRQVRTAKDKATAEKYAGINAETTAKYLSQVDDQKLARAAALDNVNILSKNPKIVGYLNKPGVGNALWGFIQDTLRVRAGSNQTGMDINVQGADLQTALMKVDPNLKLTEQDLTDLSTLTSNLARLELGLRRTRAGLGEGSMSNLEGQPYKDIIGNRYDTPAALMKKMKLAARSFENDMEIAEGFRKFDESKGGNQTLEDFKRTKEYKRINTDFESWLNKNLGIPYRKKNSERVMPTGNAILDEVERRKREKESGR